jgi:hypothetical protein
MIWFLVFCFCSMFKVEYFISVFLFCELLILFAVRKSLNNKVPRCWSKRFSTWYYSACSEGKPDLRSIAVDRRSIRSTRDLSRSITNMKKSKEIFKGNSRIEAELGLCRFVELYVGLQKGQTRTYASLFGHSRKYAGCSKHMHIHTWASLREGAYICGGLVVTSTYEFFHVNTGEISSSRLFF